MLLGYFGLGWMRRDRMVRRAGGVVLLLAILAWVPSAFGAGPERLAPAADLVRDARELRARKLPLMVLFSQGACGWCDKARNEYLLPMQRDPAYRERVLIRQVDLDSDAPLLDFAGRRTTHRQFAASEHARVTPTVTVYGPDGARLAEPIVGVRLEDFYAAYLDRAVEEGLAKLRPAGK